MLRNHSPSILARLIAGYRWLQAAAASVADFDQVLKSHTTLQTRAELERVVMLSMAAELAGLSFAPADLSLRLMPHFVPHIFQWRRLAGQTEDLTGDLRVGC